MRKLSFAQGQAVCTCWRQDLRPGLCDLRAGVLTSDIYHTTAMKRTALISPNMVGQKMRAEHLFLGKPITWNMNRLTLLMLSYFPFKHAFQ